MRVLAVETSTRTGSVALFSNGEWYERSGNVDARHGDTLLPMIQDVLSEAGCELGDLELLAAGTGPGSFTGARIALAVCKGLVLGVALPLVGVGSLCALGREIVSGEGRAGIVMDAGRGRVYAAAYIYSGSKEAVALVAPCECEPERLTSVLPAVDRIAGSAFERYESIAFDQAPDGRTFPRARFVAEEGWRRFDGRGPDDAASLEPSYVRDSDAKLPATKQALNAPVSELADA